MDEIKDMLRHMQAEMKQQKVDMLAMKEDIKNTINNNINEKFKALETKNKQLEQELEIQKKAINNFERFTRRKNLIFFGVEEQENCYQVLEEKVLSIINNILNIKCEKYYIESVRRLGIKNEKIRPIVVTLLTMGMKIQIQKNKKKLETTPYYIKEDYPLDVLKKRKELQSEVEKASEQGKKAIIKYDKLIILKNKNQQDEQRKTQNKKRNLSESPEIEVYSATKENHIKKQPLKINKNNVMNNFVIKKPTLTFSDRTSSQAHHSNQNTE